MAKTAFNRKKAVLTSKSGVNLRKKLAIVTFGAFLPIVL